MAAKSDPLVSVIIPNYNKEQYITRAIESVLYQTYNNIEIIVIDDASTDGSTKIVSNMMASHKNIRLIINDSNQGVSKSRNAGIESAQGEFVTTLDSDDIYYPDKIKKEVLLLQKNKSKAVFSNYRIINKSGNINKEIVLPQHIDYNYMIHRKGMLPRDLMYSKLSLLGELRYQEQMSLYEDWAFKLKISKISDLVNTNAWGVGYRQVGDGLSRKSKIEHTVTIAGIVWDEQADCGHVKKSLSVIKVILNMFLTNGANKLFRLIMGSKNISENN